MTSPNYRELFFAFAIDGVARTSTEIAREMGINTNATKQFLHFLKFRLTLERSEWRLEKNDPAPNSKAFLWRLVRRKGQMQSHHCPPR